MTNKKIIIPIIALMMLVIGGIFIVSNKKEYINITNDENELIEIDEILANQYYNGLPDVAKEYIKKVYLETGNILLVEENKEDNKPYLNPNFISYLEYKDALEKGEDVSGISYAAIPDDTIVDYIPEEANDTLLLPENYDLRNVAGNNYITPLKNQGSEGLCWAFAAAEHLESKIMMYENKPYNSSSTLVISPKYYDYASSYSIKDYKQLSLFKISRRELTSGGSVRYVDDLAVKNLATVSQSWNNTHDITANEMEANEVYHFNDSSYDVDTSIDFPEIKMSNLNLNDSNDYNTFWNYINDIKNYAMDNGGGIIGGLIAAGYGCEVTKPNGDVFIGNSSYCTNAGAHFEQLIGWDDNFEYQYCKDKNNSKKNLYDITSSDCVSGSQVTGRGAWLIRNSWGEFGNYSYYYLPYYTDYLSFNFYTKISKKNWDNYYSFDQSFNYVTTENGNDVLFHGSIMENSSITPQKVSRLKIYFKDQKETYKIYFGTNPESLEKVAEQYVNYAGYYSIDLSSKNITLQTNKKYYIRILDEYDNDLLDSHIYLYTNNTTTQTGIDIDDAYHTPLRISSKNNYYNVRVNGYTENISEGTTITFKVLDNNGNQVQNILYENNDVFSNRIFANLYIPKTIDTSKKYTIQAVYNGTVKDTSTLLFQTGAGTQSNPWKLSRVEDLELLRLYGGDYFELTNDIDLNNELWNPVENFVGYLDGNNHVIKNLKIRTNFNAGFFNYTYSADGIDDVHLTIKNIIFENVDVKGGSYVGTLSSSIDCPATISNISVLNGSINGSVVGGLIGIINDNNSAYNFSSIYNGANITCTSTCGGIISYYYDSDNKGMNLTNVINHGNISGKYAAGIMANVNSNSAYITNAFQYGKVEGTKKSDDIVYKGIFTGTNIYHVNDSEFDNSSNNVIKKKASEIANSSYSSWSNFNSNFKQDTVDGIKRIPLLKNVNIEYTTSSIGNITLEEDETYNLKNKINGKEDSIEYTIQDSSIASISDGILTANNSGSTTLTIESTYDGYKKTVNVDVESSAIVVRCPAGNYLPANSMTCEVCPKGYYCPEVSFTYTGQEQGKTKCPTGYTSDSSSLANTDCYINVDDGKYKTTKTGTTTEACASGKFKSSHKSYYNAEDYCYSCIEGSTSTAGSSTCTACQGKTTSGNGKPSCDADCSNKTGVATWVQASWTVNYVNNSCKVDTCLSGYTKDSTNNKCVAQGITCEAGKYLPANSSTCAQCPANSYCEGGTFTYTGAEQGRKACSSLASGSYTTSAAGSSGASSCYIPASNLSGKYVATANAEPVTCTKGYYCAGSSNISYGSTGGRTGCGDGKYNANTGSTASSACQSISAGCYGSSGTSSCPNECQGRTKYSAAGSKACSTVSSGYETIGCTSGNKCTGQKKCAAGTYCVSGVATSCVQGSMSAEGATACTACQGKTTSGAGKSSCDADCSNKTGVSTWLTASWTSNSVNNLCKIDTCTSGYTKDATNNKCIKNNDTYPIEDNYILDIVAKTNQEDFKTNLKLASGESAKIYDSNGNEIDSTRKIYTGSITKVYKNNAVIRTYTNIVLGDTNRDGNMDISDVSKLYTKVLRNNVNDDLIELSGDANKDKRLDISDVSKIYNFYLNNKILN